MTDEVRADAAEDQPVEPAPRVRRGDDEIGAIAAHRVLEGRDRIALDRLQRCLAPGVRKRSADPFAGERCQLAALKGDLVPRRAVRGQRASGQWVEGMDDRHAGWRRVAEPGHDVREAWAFVRFDGDQGMSIG